MRLRARVTQLGDEVSIQLALHIDVPLLHVGHGKIKRETVHGGVGVKARACEGKRIGRKSVLQKQRGGGSGALESGSRNIRGIVLETACHTQILVSSIEDAGTDPDHGLAGNLISYAETRREIVGVETHLAETDAGVAGGVLIHRDELQ